MTLTEFLLERIAEDEEAAEAIPTKWMEPDPDDIPAWLVGHVVIDRARVLADLEAKRSIVERCGILQERAALWTHERLKTDPSPAYDLMFETHTEQILRYMAALYADHPDYRKAWRP